MIQPLQLSPTKIILVGSEIQISNEEPDSDEQTTSNLAQVQPRIAALDLFEAARGEFTLNVKTAFPGIYRPAKCVVNKSPASSKPELQFGYAGWPNLVARVRDYQSLEICLLRGTEIDEVLYISTTETTEGSDGAEFQIWKNARNQCGPVPRARAWITETGKIFTREINTIIDDVTWKRLEPKFNGPETRHYLDREQLSSRIHQLFFLGLAALRMLSVKTPNTVISVGDNGPASPETGPVKVVVVGVS
ncbi:hypothetical protein DFH06DRAFT_1348974 [Mycena polygramma]|nr:hypothetical protein DFH06DRAFT_1348974 [Mycena polygramma]